MPDSDSTAAMAAVASRFLDALDERQRNYANVRFDNDTRFDWHYIPRTRPGLALGDMTARQQKAAYDLLGTGVSVAAFAVATTVIGLEDVLDLLEEGRGPRRTGPREHWGRHRADYSTIVFGSPAAGGSWGWRFEGHHVSVNVTIVDGDIASTPLFLGANPAEVTTNTGAVVTRPLAGEEDMALALFASLDARQRERALLGKDAPADILSENAPVLEAPLEPLGLRFANLGGSARDHAEQLVRLYLDRLPAPAAAKRWTRLEPHFGDVAIAVAGHAEHRRPQYYRMQGPGFFVEYDNTQDDANHVHTVLRDPDGDFGADVLRQHRASHHR